MPRMVSCAAKSGNRGAGPGPLTGPAPFDTGMRYCDAPGSSQVPDTSRSDIRVVAAPRPTGGATALPVIITAAIAIGAGYYLLVMRKKK
jgi:hypothetical protein